MIMKKIYWAIFIALAAAVGCTQSNVEELAEGVGNEPKGSFKISVSTEDDSATRVDIDGTLLTWSEYDMIYAVEIGDDGEYVAKIYPFSIDSESISADGKTADFYGDELTVGKSYVAFSAFNIEVVDDSDYSQYMGTAGLLAVCAPLNTWVYYDRYDIEAFWAMSSQPFEVVDETSPSLAFKSHSSYFDFDISFDDSLVGEHTIATAYVNAPQNMFSYWTYFDTTGQIVNRSNNNSLELLFGDGKTVDRNSNFKVYMPFVPNTDVVNVVGDFTISLVTDDGAVSEVTVPARALASNKVYTKELVFSDFEDDTANDRELLIEFYEALDGDSWINNENWCSDAPLDEWYGVSVNEFGRVTYLDLYGNNLSGTISESIGGLTYLTFIRLDSNNIGGSLPQSIGELSNLTTLSISHNSLEGAVPESICDLVNLVDLDLCSNKLSGSIPESIGDFVNLAFLNLGSNQLSGSIPESIGNLVNLETLMLYYNNDLTGSIPESMGNLLKLCYIDLDGCTLTGGIPLSLLNLQGLSTFCLQNNNLSGVIPEEFGNAPWWNKQVWSITAQRVGYGFTSVPDVYLEPSSMTTIEGDAFNTEDYFAQNELTCVVLWRSWCGFSTYYMETLKDLYANYESKGFGLLSLNDETVLDDIVTYVDNNDIPGDVCQVTGWDYSDGSNRIKYMPTMSSPTYAYVDSEGKVLFSELIYPLDDPSVAGRNNESIAFVAEFFGEEITKYESTDYSKDGEVLTLQSASVGDGIDVVIVGDGYVDTDMDTDGEYERRMKQAMEYFFSEEPYTTLRDRFNIYAVKAISKNKGVEDGNSTIFGVGFGEGTYIYGNNNKVFEYALKVPSITDTEGLMVIAVVNSSRYSGTCVMYYDDAAVAYCPIAYDNDDCFRELVNHEAGGHGFGKLLDEYVAYEGVIPYSEISDFQEQKGLGWGANVDVTDDPETIQWAHFLSNPLYDGLVDIYEGSLTYEFGAYRPTDYSIMRYNTGGYNAPSREAIYRRTMELSGEEYSYEEFEEYDQINRSVQSCAYHAASAAAVDKYNFVPLAPPVVVKGAPGVVKR